MSIEMKVWFGPNGELLHFGEWDHRVEHVEVGTREITVDVPDDYALQPDEEWVDETPGAKKITRKEPVFEEREMNPIPPGAYCEEREVVQTAGGGLALAEDYAALRRAAYPGYTPYDLIDEILKVIDIPPGSKLEEIQQQRLAVKAQYPKPEGSAE